MESLHTHLHGLLQSPVANLLWIPAVAGLVWMFGPLVLFWSRFRKMQTVGNEDAAQAERPTGDSDLDRIATFFGSRNFGPVGWMSEHCPFFTPVHWKFVGPRELVLGAPDRTTHVVAYRIGSLSVKMSAHTALDGGGLLSTSTVQSHYKGDLGARYHRVEIETEVPDELIAAHERHVRALCEQRGLRPRCVSLNELIAEIESISRPFIARSRLAKLYILPALALFPLVRTSWAAEGVPSATLSLECLSSLISFALLRVLVLPEFSSPWKALALAAIAIQASPDHWPLSVILGR
jgi:hypothetical protein